MDQWTAGPVAYIRISAPNDDERMHEAAAQRQQIPGGLSTESQIAQLAECRMGVSGAEWFSIISAVTQV